MQLLFLKDKYTDNHLDFIDYKSHNPALREDRSFVLTTVYRPVFYIGRTCDKVCQHESLDWRYSQYVLWSKWTESTDPVLMKLVQYRSTSSLKMRSARENPDDENGSSPSTSGAPNAYAMSSLCSVSASLIPFPTDAAQKTQPRVAINRYTLTLSLLMCDAVFSFQFFRRSAQKLW